MKRHSFDPLSAALGITAVAVGLLIALAEIDDLEADGGLWLAIGALILGLGLIPWVRQRTSSEPDEPIEPTPE